MGPNNALELTLHMPYVSDYYAFKSTYGAHVYVHNKSTVPNYNDGVDVAVNQQTSIAVSRVFSSTLPSPYSGCVQDTAKYGSVFTNMFAENNLTYKQARCFKYT